MTDRSKVLSEQDRDILQGHPDIYWEEPDQLIPEIYDITTESSVQNQILRKRTYELKDKAIKLLERIEKQKKEIDSRCGHLQAAGPIDNEAYKGADGQKRTPLYQAMKRIFGIGANTITYAQYVRALEMRNELASKEREALK